MDSKQDNIKASPLVELIARNRSVFCAWLILIGIVLAVATVVLAFWVIPWATARIMIWGVGLSLAFLLPGIAPFVIEPERGHEESYARGLVLALGGFTGLAITVGGLALVWAWWSDIVSWISPTSEGKEFMHLVYALGAVIGGSALMFVSAQIARTEERSSPGFRRILYGYNAILSVETVLVIVGILSVVITAGIKAPLDFTASRDFTLSDKGIKVLRAMTVPVKVTFFRGFRDILVEDQTQTLLNNCQNYTDKLEVKELYIHQDQSTARTLAKQYPGLRDQDGGCLLLVYQLPGSDKEEHRIIPERDLTGQPDMFDRGAEPSQKFTGEDALMTVLNGMSEDKDMPTIYFTQGHNELDPNDLQTAKIDTACGQLKRRLEQRKSFDIKTLTFDTLKPKVPDKTPLVCIIGPRQPFQPPEVKALQEYLARGGRLLIMVDLIVGSDKKPVETGLEPLLAEHGVMLGNERVITLPFPYRLPPNDVLSVMNPKYIQQNPLVATFSDDRFQMSDVRVLHTQGDKPGGRFLTMPIMVISTVSFTDDQFGTDAAKVVAELRGNEEALNKKVQEIQMGWKTRGPMPVGVAVTEAPPNDPHAGIAGPSNPKPKMLVIGNASMAGNRFMDERSRQTWYFDFVASAIEWLRGKEQNIGIAPKVNQPFILSTRSEDEKGRIIFLPLVLVVGSVLGLACGVWIVRRR